MTLLILVFTFEGLHLEDLESANINVLLWLIVNNKILMRDNLAKCKPIDDPS